MTMAVGKLMDEEFRHMRMVERFPDPDHGVIKRVRLGPKGKVWAAEVKRMSAQTEARWATRLGSASRTSSAESPASRKPSWPSMAEAPPTLPRAR